MAHRRQPSRHTRGPEAAAVEIGEIIAQCFGVGTSEIPGGAGQKCGKILKVAAIGLQRIVARTLLRREHVEEEVGQPGVGELAHAVKSSRYFLRNLSAGMEM